MIYSELIKFKKEDVEHLAPGEEDDGMQWRYFKYSNNNNAQDKMKQIRGWGFDSWIDVIEKKSKDDYYVVRYFA